MSGFSKKDCIRDVALEIISSTIEEAGEIQPLRRSFDPKKDPLLAKTGVAEIELVIDLPQQFLAKMPIPKECQGLAVAHMSFAIGQLMLQVDDNVRELLHLSALYIKAALELGYDCLKQNIDYNQEWIPYAEKYKTKGESFEQLQSLQMFLLMLQGSKSIGGGDDK
jgi:hypothetical protein